MKTTWTIILIAAAIVFFVVALVVQLTFNYVAPRLAHSLNKSYNIHSDFRKISYLTAIVLVILVSVLFNSSRAHAACASTM